MVAPHGPGQELSGARARAEPPHFLYVGDDEPRKNLGLLLGGLRALPRRAAAPLELVLAGLGSRAGWRGRPARSRAPARARLAELHAQAAALVHPRATRASG